MANGTDGPKGPEDYDSLGSDELEAGNFPTEFRVRDILVADAPAIVGGPKKSLKTSTLVDLAISIDSGEPFLGRFDVLKTARVGMMSGESGKPAIRETALRVARAKGIELQDCAIRWAFRLPRLGDDDSEIELRGFVERHSLEVLIVDPAYLSIVPGCESSVLAMGKTLSTLSRLASDLGCQPILAHHSTKGLRPGTAPSLDDLSWAGFAEWARQWILLNRRSRFDPSKPGEHRLRMVAGGSAGHCGDWNLDVFEDSLSNPGGRRWEVSVQDSSSSPPISKPNRSEADLERVSAVLRESGADTKSSIGRRLNLNSANCNAAVTLGLERGVLQHCKVRKGGKSHSAIQLTQA